MRTIKNKSIRSLLIFSVLIFISIKSFAQPVTTEYINKLVSDSKSHLQLQVKNGQMAQAKADLIIEIIESTAKAAMRDGLSVKDYEQIFNEMTIEDCQKFKTKFFGIEWSELMMGYNQADINSVIENVQKICEYHYKERSTRLALYVNIHTYLRSKGII